MTKEQILSIIRHVFSASAGVLMAIGMLQESATNDLIGAAMMLISTVWSIFDKTIMWDRVSGVIRHVLTALGAFASLKATLSEDVINAIVSMVITIIPLIQGQIEVKKKEVAPIEQPKELAS